MPENAKEKEAMRTINKKMFSLILLLSILCFFFIDLLTIKTNDVSGNGNLGLPFYPLACIFILAVTYFLVGTYIIRLENSTFIVHTGMVISSGVILYVCITAAIQKFKLRIEELEQTMSVQTTFMQEYGWVDIHLGNLYFNVYTYAAIISLGVLLASLYCLLRRKSR
jgi:hypothetical protein